MIIKHNARDQLIQQLSTFYGTLSTEEMQVISNVHSIALERLSFNFSHIDNKYYHNNEQSYFNPLHVTQYTMYLYTISSEIRRKYGHMIDLCDKIYGLLKTISSADIYYEVNLPDIWFCDHPQGSVIGRASYANYFSFTQGCTVGNNKGIYPHFEEHVTMFSNSKILGDCHVSNHVIMAANSCIIDTDIPKYSIVFGLYPNPVIHRITEQKFFELTNSIFKNDVFIS